MSRRLLVTLAVACGTLFVLVVAFRDRLFERVEEVVDRGYRGEAAVNPYFALEQLFVGMGVPARSVPSLRRLPPSNEVLWLLAPNRRSSIERLVGWVREGGHLVVVPVDPVEDPLLPALGVGLFDAESADEDDHESRSPYDSDRPPWPLLYTREDLEIVRSDGAPDAAWLLSVRIGAGTATVLSDGAFLRNDAIGAKDHALIAWTAAALDGPPAGVWLAYRDPMPSVWSLVTARMRPVTISLVVLLVAGLLAQARRFGPMHESPPDEQRLLAEHVRATGGYLWRVGCEYALIDAEREALRHRLGHGLQLGDEDFEALAVAAGGPAGSSAEEIREALETHDVRDRRRFTRIIHTLETLRRGL